MARGVADQHPTLFDDPEWAEPAVETDGVLSGADATASTSGASPYDLGPMAEQFLTHLAASRRCSPRTVEAYACDYRKVERLLRQLGRELDVRCIRTGDLQLCLGALGHLSAASVERLIYAVSSLFSYLVRQGIISVNPALGVDRPVREQKVPRHASRSQVEAVLGACESTQERLIVGLLAFAGLRRSELLGLNVADVAADFTSLRVRGKGRKERIIPLHPTLQPLLAEHLRDLEADGDALLRNRVGTRMCCTSLHRVFQRLVRNAGGSARGLTPHALRHHFGSELAAQGVDVVTISELMGHSNISVTSVYLHSTGPAKRAAIECLPGVSAEPSETGRAAA